MLPLNNMMKVYAEKEAEDFLKKHVPVARNALLSAKHTKKDFWKPPFVLKLISKKALHKSDIGGVKIVRSESDAEEAYTQLVKIAERKNIPYRILMQEFIEGDELIVGLKQDQAFGHTIMLGTGGTLVELIKDVSFRVCPITEKDAQNMIDELKLKPILYGFRGRKNANVEELKKTLVAVSRLPEKHKIKEMDINPLIINDKEATVVDARIVFE
jgi:acetate---CoA ligase (ADP-forming) subunit beta